MIVDFERLEDGAKISADICIVGAGAAGITIARELVATGLGVCVLESGGLDLDYATQQLYAGDDVGHADVWNLLAGRLRFFGGSTNHWGGWCGTFSELDFSSRDWIPYSGWPLSRSDLDPYYVRAHDVCELGPYSYDPQKLQPADLPLPVFDSSKLSTRFWRFSPPTHFGLRYRTELESSGTVTVYLHANVLEFFLDGNGNHIRQCSIRSLSGRNATVTAKVFVLACGAIENARILLLQNHERSQGLGNEHDLVGRFYMSHPHIASARILPRNAEKTLATFDLNRRGKIPVRPGICISDEAQRREGVANCSVTLGGVRRVSTGYLALKGLIKDFKKGHWPEEFMDRLGTVLNDADGTASAAYDAFKRRYNKGQGTVDIGVFTRSEQIPNRESRIILCNELDALGQRKAQRDWRLARLDKETIQATHRLLGEELGRLNLGRLRLEDWLVGEDAEFPDSVGDYGHHIGTTRMSKNPREGVVDADCRMHSVSNFYIAGSSVFPTGGCINPTLTIVALALRLADHLKTVVPRSV